MPFSETIVFATFEEEFVFQGNFFPNPNYSLQRPPSVSPSGGEPGPALIRHWIRTVTITFDIESFYDFRYGDYAFSGFNPDTLVITVEETWSKLSGIPWSATYTNTTDLGNLLFGELGNFVGTGVVQIPFTAAADGNGAGPITVDVRNIEVFGESVSFVAHSYFSGGYELSAGSAIHARVPGFSDDFASTTNYWRPTTGFRVLFKPVDLDGNQVSKKVLIYIGDLERLADGSPIDATDDVSEYLHEATTPVDQIIEITGRGVRFSRRVDKHLAPLVLDEQGGDAIQCEAVKCRIFWRYENFGLSPAAYDFAEVQAPIDYPIRHLFADDAGTTDVTAAILDLPSSKDLNSSSWTADGTGASVAGDQLTAAATQGTFENHFVPVSTGTPYRWLAFDYEVHDGSPSITLEAVGSDFGSESLSGKKTYTVAGLTGSGTAYIDTLKPSSVGSLSVSELLKLETFNQAQQDEESASVNRFDGLRALHSVKIRFRNAVVSITNLRMVARYEAVLSHRVGTADDGSAQTQHQMAGHVDGRDSFRIDHATILDLVNGLAARQGLDIVSTSYSLPSHAPVPTLATRPTVDLAVQDNSLNLQPDQNVLAGAEIKASVSSVAGVAFFYGLKQLGWFNEVKATAIWGNEASVTAVGSDKPTTVRVVSPSVFPVFDLTYDSAAYGFGRENLPDHRYRRLPNPLDVEHYVPRHPAPQTKATYNLNSNGRRFHIYVQSAAPGLNGISYDVSSSLRHYRAFIEAGTVWTGYSDNLLEEWNDTDTGIEAESVLIRIDRRGKAQGLYLWVGTPATTVDCYRSENEGESWDMSYTVGAGAIPFGDIGLNNVRYLYRIDGGDVIGQIRDASDQILEPDFVAIPGVEEEGGSAHESVMSGGRHRIVIQVRKDGAIQVFQSENGIDNWI